ncbi:MAG: hypothetical protein WCO45_18015 [Pseudanabaena sp. ELA607]|jgi:oligoribonuclease NrnB/cAMP/cGMP phosphodiesterase (DHH superfamily)
MSSIERVSDSISKVENLHDATSPVSTITHQAQEVVDSIVYRRKSFLERLFPDPRTKIIVEGEIGLLKSEFAFRRAALEKVRSGQIQSLSERINEYLEREKAGIRAERAAFLMEKRRSLQETMESEFDKFITHMVTQYEKVEGIKVKKLKDLKMEQLDRDCLGFAAFQETLMKDFENIISASERI